MQVTVQLTKAELAEMDVTGQQLESGIIQRLDGGIEIEGDGKVYLAGFNVDVKIVD
jgi:hypothetical protein